MVRHEGDDTPGFPESPATESEVRGLISGIDEELARHDMLPSGTEDEIAAAYGVIARTARYSLEKYAARVIKDIGSIDSLFVRQIGVNVASSLDMLKILTDRARAEFADETGQVTLADLVAAGQQIDIERMERRQTAEAAFYLLNHAVMEEDVNALLETNRYRLRVLARRLNDPISFILEESLLEDAMEGRKHPLEEIAMQLLEISDKYSREQAALERGDSDALARRKQMLDHPELVELGDEVALRQEEEELPGEIPKPEDNV